MNIKGHLTGGLISAGLLSAGLHFTEVYPLAIQDIGSSRTSSLTGFLTNSNTGEHVKLFLICLFMSLFPDVDTASKIRFFTYRVILVVALLLIIKGELLILSVMLILSILPQISHHRSWTHYKITPIIICAVLIFVGENFMFHASTAFQFSTKSIFLYLGYITQKYGPLSLAVIFGYYTHLVLDSKWIASFK